MSIASDGGERLWILDRALYALFSRHADSARHDRDRRRYRGTDLRTSFEVYVARIYGLSIAVFLAVSLTTLVVGLALPNAIVAGAATMLWQLLPPIEVTPPQVPRTYAALAAALLVGAIAKRTTVAAGGQYLGWRARGRQADIEITLPGSVRYLRTLAAGTDDPREMLEKVAVNEDAYGETAVACRKVLNKAVLTGSLEEALRMVARDTPSRDALAPFLLKFREHAAQGPDELETYLRMESRMLDHRQRRARERAEAFLELVAELFVVLLVLPALLVIVVTVMGVLSPGLSEPVTTPFGTITTRELILYGAIGFVLSVGGLATTLVESLRPAGLSAADHARPDGIVATISTTLSNPASAAVVHVPLGIGVAALVWSLGGRPVEAGLAGYVVYGLPVGVVAARRAALDEAKDREIKDLVHAISGHVSLGRPFPEAVEVVARDVDLGPLNEDVATLAFTANLTTGTPGLDGDEVDSRTAALDRFVEQVGTPLAEQTMGLVTGALDVGSDTDDVFETLQTEIGRLHHEKKALQANMLVYVAVGWTTALLIVGIMVAVVGYVLDGFAQMDAVAGQTTGVGIDGRAIDPEEDSYQFYLVTQATMLACGWFAGTARRGYYEGLLHSSALVVIAHVVFAGVGLI